MGKYLRINIGGKFKLWGTIFAIGAGAVTWQPDYLPIFLGLGNFVSMLDAKITKNHTTKKVLYTNSLFINAVPTFLVIYFFFFPRNYEITPSDWTLALVYCLEIAIGVGLCIYFRTRIDNKELDKKVKLTANVLLDFLTKAVVTMRSPIGRSKFSSK